MYCKYMYVVLRLTHETAVHAVDPDPALREAVGAPKSAVMLDPSGENSVGGSGTGSGSTCF
jgi:hypothetical protein